MQTRKPILKKVDQIFEQKQPSGLNAALAEIAPAVKFDRKKYKNTQKFDDPNDVHVYRKKTPAQLHKEQTNYLIPAKLQPTNHPEMEREALLGNILNNNKRYNQPRWKQGPAVVRSSVNLTRAKRAKKNEQPYNLQQIVVSNRIKEQRQQMKEKQLQAQGKSKIQSRRNAEARAKARAKIVQPVNMELQAPVKKTRRRKQNSPAPNTNKVKTRFQARKAKAERLEAERLAELQRVLNQSNSNSNSNSKSESNSNGSNSNSSNDSWQAYQKSEGEKHMAR